MKFLLKDMSVLQNGAVQTASLLVEDGRIASFSPSSFSEGQVFQFEHAVLLPGFVDVHVHFREPGFSYKETIRTGTQAAARGGYTTVCPMPNLLPVPDSVPNLQQELEAIRRDAVIRTLPYGAISVGEKGKALADLAGMAPYVAAFSDDGRGVQDPGLMKEAMVRAKALGKLIVAHCEDESLVNGGYIHDGEYAKARGHRGNPSASEWKQVERDLELVRDTGCAYHICHISTKESVALLRAAKRDGLDVTGETTPHYLLLNDSQLQEEGRFKMNPPIRGKRDQEALLEGIQDGTIELIATDHAPHSAQEKSGGLAKSLNGIVGLETAFPVLYTGLVKTGVISLEKLVELLSLNPARRFGLEAGLTLGGRADFTVFDLEQQYTIDPGEFLSLGKSTPFEGETVYGRCLLTVSEGAIAWREKGGDAP